MANSLSSELSVPLAVVTCLFFMWAVALNLNDILVPHLKKACDLSDLQSSLIQTCYFSAYFLAALPAGWLMKRIGYKGGIITGLLFCALGAFLFYPASYSRAFSSFLFALFVMACGAAILEVGANAYVVILGNPETAEFRLNLVQAFNALGAAVASKVGKMFILSGIELSIEEQSAMSTTDMSEYRAMEASLVRTPYAIIGAIFLGIVGLVYHTRLPEVTEETEGKDGKDALKDQGEDIGLQEGFWRLLRHTHFVAGVVTLFFYVGAQVGVCSFLIRFVQATSPEVGEKEAADYLFYHLMLFLVGRIVGTAIMNKMKAKHVLALFSMAAALLAVTCVIGSASNAIIAVVLIGFFNSIMFPTIFSLSMRGLGSLTKTASSILVMSIVGGAVVPTLMGYLSDTVGIRMAFLTLVFSYGAVFIFAAKGTHYSA